MSRGGILLLLAFQGIQPANAEDSIRPLDRTIQPTSRIRLLNFVESELDMSIDGKLLEPQWRDIEPQTDFGTVEPDTLVPGKHLTELRVFYSEKGVYVGFDLHQPKDTLLNRLSSRDNRGLNRDAVFITFDSSSEARYGFWFGVALGGSLLDGTILPERRYSPNWDGPWRGATSETEHGWSAEMFIPWSVMSMPKREAERNIGVYASRKVGYLDERWAWPALPSTKPQFLSVLDQYEVVGVSPRQQYSIFPYLSSTLDRISDETDSKAGADIFWRPTTNFQLAATLNPDFGSVESDDVIVNLSATETFFPEKRLFFLEGQDVFIATPKATNNVPTTLLNTRRIGGRAFSPEVPTDVEISSVELGQPAELLGAAKLTGESGNFRYGLLSAIEDDTTFFGEDGSGSEVKLEQDGRNYAVARVLYEDASGGATRGLGWMSTAVLHPDREAVVHGVDGHYLTGDGLWQLDGQVFYSDIDVEGTGIGGFLDTVYTPEQGVKHMVELEYFDRDVNINDLGFFRRNDSMALRYSLNLQDSSINYGRELRNDVSILQLWNLDKRLIRSGLFWKGYLTNDNLSEWRTKIDLLPERYEDRNSFGNGTYKIEQRYKAGIGYKTDTSKKLSADFLLERGPEDKGGYNIYSWLKLTYRPVDRLSTSLSLSNKNREGWLLHFAGDSMSTYDAEEWKAQWDFDFFFTAKQQFRASFQWVGIRAFEDERYTIPSSPGHLIEDALNPADESRQFSISNLNFQLRYRWEIAPLSDLFVVYTKNSNERYAPIEQGDFQDMLQSAYHNPSSEQLVVKLRYRLGS
ncbi:DUF5916 domain-containing protein [Aurantivibrio plasticivorans]